MTYYREDHFLPHIMVMGVDQTWMDSNLCLENPGYWWNIRYPSDTRRKLKLRKILMFIIIRVVCQIDLIFCTEHDNIIAVLCAKFQTDWAIPKYARDKRD